jgi:HK97 gp10 family phage protein
MRVARQRVVGDKELMRSMRKLPQAAAGRTLDQALGEGLRPMRDRTAENARKLRQPHTPKGGHLDEGVVIVRREAKGNYYRTFWISFARRARKISHLVEFGTRPHAQPRRGIMHPGARPKPFMRPAFESTKHQVVREVGVRIWYAMRDFTLAATKTRRR